MKRFAVALLLLTGCDGDPFGPDARYFGREQFTPDWTYAAYYADTETCLGMRGDFDAVRWFAADAIVYGGRRVYGFLDVPHDITVPVTHVVDMITVRHEAEHHIRYLNTGQWGNHLPDGGMPCDGAH